MDIMKEVLKFTEVTAIMFLMINNKKYNSSNLLKLKEFEYFDFIEDFAYNMTNDENLVISTLPQLLIKNIVTTNTMIRYNLI